MAAPSAQASLEQAMALARAGHGDAAEALLVDFLAQSPEDPDALQLLGLVARGRKDNARAADLFRRSLAARPGQPNVLNNLGNALRDLAQPEQAVEAYREAVRLEPGYSDAHVNLGLALLSAGRPDEARDSLEALVHSDRRNARAWAAMGRALRGCDRIEEAILAFRTSLTLRPNDVPTQHNLAVALRLSGKAEEAARLLEHCAAARQASAEIRYNLGHAYQDLGRLEEAAAAYEAAVTLKPEDRDAHDSLNRLYWQMGDPRYLASYGPALVAARGNSGLLADLANRLNLGGRTGDTIGMLDQAIASGTDSAEIRHRLAQARWAEGDREEAFRHYGRALELEPAADDCRLALVRALIVDERYAEALDAVQPVLERRPNDQQAIAYHGLASRFLGDPGAERLNDYDRFVREFRLVPPPEWGDTASFNHRLEQLLAGLHNMRQHPLEQTLRGGTQTMGELFDRHLPEIDAVRAMIEAALRDYIAALPDDPDHPFLSRKSGGFRFNGSWSVRLRSQGFHLNHVHSEGWISSCYYVGLPKAVGRGQEGWIKFGETGLALGERELVAKAIRPEVGKLVLFPSYMYHGTVPFEEADAFRTTIAFDVIPA
jgi:tetratricopeptide (TPR) repeat protein